MICFGLIWACGFVSGYLVYTYGRMRSKVKKISHHGHVTFHFQTNKKTNSEIMPNSRCILPRQISIDHKLPFQLEQNECLFSYKTYTIGSI